MVPAAHALADALNATGRPDYKGLVSGGVKAAVDRVGARGYEALADEPAPSA